MVTAYLVLLGLLVAERLFELGLSRKHAAWAFARGGVESGQRHFRVMKAVHTFFFAACAAEVVLLARPFYPALALSMLGVALFAQALRYWAIATLGPSWNVRVIVVPGAPAVAHGPYRFVRHPNYLAVLFEAVAVPLMHSAYLSALVFFAANAALLLVRIRCEEAALETHCDYARRLGGRPRFVPWSAA